MDPEKKSTWIKIGFLVGLGWWLAVAFTTILDLGGQFILYSLMAATTGQGV